MLLFCLVQLHLGMLCHVPCGTYCTHGCNFVVKCGGTAWCETNVLRNLKRKMWGGMADGTIYSHCLKKWERCVPRVPHLIAPMTIYTTVALHCDNLPWVPVLLLHAFFFCYVFVSCLCYVSVYYNMKCHGCCCTWLFAS